MYEMYEEYNHSGGSSNHYGGSMVATIVIPLSSYSTKKWSVDSAYNNINNSSFNNSSSSNIRSRCFTLLTQAPT